LFQITEPSKGGVEDKQLDYRKGKAAWWTIRSVLYKRKLTETLPSFVVFLVASATRAHSVTIWFAHQRFFPFPS
jgi:hypothetical protein